MVAEIINHMMTLGSQCNEKEILDKYREYLMVIGKIVLIAETSAGTETGETYEALVLDIDDIGRLIVRKTDTTEVLTLSSGEIRIWENPYSY